MRNVDIVPNTLDDYVLATITDMWNRLEVASKNKSTSLAAIAESVGVSSSSIYHAVRTIRKGMYVDSKVNDIITLANILDISIDTAVFGMKEVFDENEMLSDWCRLLMKLPKDKANEIRDEIIKKLKLFT